MFTPACRAVVSSVRKLAGLILILMTAQSPAQPASSGFDDHRNMMDQLGVKALRRGPDPNNQNTFDEATANPYTNSMPDVLTMKSGTRVTRADEWPARRAEIQEDFEREVYGRIPATVPKVTWEVTATTHGTNGGIPTVTKTLVGHVDNSAYTNLSVQIQASFTVPAAATSSVPIMVEFGGGFGFGGRPGREPGWHEQAITNGWGYGSIVPSSIQADNNHLTSGIIGLANKGQPRKPDDWGSLRAWQWGVSRLIDYFENHPDSKVDATKVGIEGLSRYGKAAIVTEAFEPRIAVGLIGSSGEGGVKLHRHIFGEGVENLAGGEYYWMAGNFIKYGASEPLKTAADLPVDSHELIAMCAPRPCFISYGVIEHGDAKWVDAHGSFMAGVLAGPVYRLLGKKDFGTPGDYLTDPMPPVNQLIGGELAWRQHDGGHDVTPNWPAFFKWVANYIKAPPMAAAPTALATPVSEQPAGTSVPPVAMAAPVAQERISINDNWRFIKGDPSNCPVNLLYDKREEKTVRRIADAEADGNSSNASTTEGMTNAPQAVIKEWVLPSGNEFIKDASRKFIRPEGNLGDRVAYVQPGFDDSSWRQINLPHDWAIEGPFTHSGGGGMGRLPSAGVGWYRKKLSIPAEDAGKMIFLDVDGAMSYAVVWLNGQLVGGWPFGYASWRLDLTPYVKPGGVNELAIRLDNPPNSSRWYPGAGIYRNVWLVKTSPVHIGHWGTQLTTPDVSRARASVNLKVTIDNDSKQKADVSVATEIFLLDANGKKVGAAVASIAPVNLQIAPAANTVSESSGAVVTPRLWGPPPQQRPNRYVAVTTLSQAGKVVDAYETPFGIRTLKFDPNAGVVVNGERIELKGVCDHHDLGALGTALNNRALQRQLEMLQEMGCNAIRTSHNPPAPELLELTDKMGFLVMDETFDVWVRQKTPLDFHLIFPDWHEQDLRAHLRRDRNHPSVIMWSIGNEVGEQFTGESGAAVAKELCGIVREEDATRPTVTAMNWAQATHPLPATVDLIGLNYQGAGVRTAPSQYPAFREKFPDKLIFSSESASALSSRGEFIFPVTASNSLAVGPNSGEDRQRHQVSAYELYCAAFGSSPDRVFASQESHPYAGGEFVWTGWDYLGEPTPFDTSRSSYSGIIDLAGFKKDRFYIYQAHWRPDFPMAHILPHWTWPEREGQVTPVHVFTSGDEGELFLNGKSLGRKKKGAYEYRLRWDDVVYKTGTLKVVAYKNGQRWATDEVKTAGEPAKLKLEPERTEISADGRDLSFVTVTVTDKGGSMVPRANNRIHFDIEGPGDIIATDNGDPTSFELFQSHDRKAFNGLSLVIVRGKPGQTGEIKLTAMADGLKTGAVSIKTKLDAN